MTKWHLYVGCFTKDLWTYFPRPETDTTIPSPGIERLLFDDVTGSLRYVGVAGGDLSSPQYLELHPHLRVLYAAEFAWPGRLVAFDICSDGQLMQRATVDSLGAMAVATSVHPSGNVAYVGHLGDGVLTSCALDPGGGIQGAIVVHPGTIREDPNHGAGERFAYRGSGPKHHQVRVTPDGGGLVVTDVGSDAVVTYAVESLDGSIAQPISQVSFPAGSAPRHVDFHPSGKVAYVVGEGDATLYVLEARQHVPLRILSSHPLAPPGEVGECLPSELHLHPDGRTLFVGLRRADCIAVFDVDDSGGVRILYHESSGGRNPRAVRVSPSGSHLLVGNWDSNGVAVFSVDDARRLRLLGEPVEVPSPSSFAFVAVSR
ncbi:beta-propeller fold lactonase family protein [Rhodococcus sp. IEGM 1307]|uniref:lactonase family protein n=1 Tax=Rhodococcus sp. IEGM 1307 TaxID=3047091 RepID=UPI0024B6BD1B|nr:beta-propeller fold lactonase family protein [Rhodococcus sp. IEGM 1307]MDI9979613.1 beta-propeller fold lactonase family protein [Rhodococcus sp. IEGM 1307]